MQPDHSIRQAYQNTFESLDGNNATLAVLIDMADGNPFAIFEYAWIREALVSRELIIFNLGTWDDQVGAYSEMPSCGLTEYGAGFVAWLREPRDLPVQLTFFEEDDHAAYG